MKLDEFPHILWINMDKSIERRQYMEIILDEYNLENTRITAIDGSTQQLEKICVSNPYYSPEENACTCSHLTALKYFVEMMDDDEIIIFEDDVDFLFLPYIPYNWLEFRKIIPDIYDLIQLSISSVCNIIPKLVKRHISTPYYSSTAYLITKKTAITLIDKYFRDDGMIDLSIELNSTSDYILMNFPNIYSIPIFSYQTENSTIHQSHKNMHDFSKNQQWNEWIHYKHY